MSKWKKFSITHDLFIEALWLVNFITGAHRTQEQISIKVSNLKLLILLGSLMKFFLLTVLKTNLLQRQSSNPQLHIVWFSVLCLHLRCKLATHYGPHPRWKERHHQLEKCCSNTTKNCLSWKWEIEEKRGAKRGQIRAPTTQPTTELNAPPTLLVQPSAIFECYKESPEQNVAESK